MGVFLSNTPLTDAERSLHTSERFVFIDGLRGIAAIAVVLFHFHHAMEGRPGFVMFLGPVHWLFKEAWLEVEVFFVISGFVIAHSLRKITATWSFIGHFALRRSLRLDPPYWTTIAAVTLSLWLSARLHPGRPNPATPRVVLANMFYVQYILNFPPLLDIFWTLCLEVQFYLLCVLLLHLTQPVRATHVPSSTAYIVAMSAIFSIAANFSGHSFAGWFIDYWYMFAGGLLAYWTWRRILSPVAFAVYLIAVIGLSVLHRGLAPMVIAFTSLIIYIAAIRGRLTVWLGGCLWQSMGKISYSLYLSHGVFAGAMFDYGLRLLGPSTFGSLACFIIVLIVSLGLAVLMYLLVERPSHRFSSRVGLAQKNRIALVSA
jgi:peptidoglycan/LPS O-acetylase OafA/YrhL